MKNIEHVIKDFALVSGRNLSEITIAYNTMGTLDTDGRNAVLLAHGYTSGPDLASPTSTAVEGSWSGIVGPGKAIDTNRFFVVCPNMLGSSYGSTNAASIDPESGERYGSKFPDITLEDIVATQRDLIGTLGISHLAAVVGPSYGGFQAFQWAVTYPEFVSGIAAVTCAPYCPATDIKGIIGRLATDPNWNGGNYYQTGNVKSTLASMRADTLRAFGIDAVLTSRFQSISDRNDEVERLARSWADRFDANSMVILMKAAAAFDVRSDFSKIKARVFYALSTTDRLFPPSLASDVMSGLAKADVSAEYHEIQSEYGHFASGVDSEKWSAQLRRFMNSLDT